MPGCRARRRRTRDGTRTGRAAGGRCGRSRRSWLTPGTPGGRCGTGSRRRRSWPTRPTPGSGTSRCSGGTCPRVGSSPSIPRTRRWSAKPTSSPPRRPRRRAARPGPLSAGTCWPGSSRAGGAGGGWNQLVQRQARLPVPPRLHQRCRPRSGPAQEHLRPRGPGPAAPGRYCHPARRPCRDARPREPRPGAADRPDDTAALIDRLRADGTVLTYDPDGRTLRAGDHDAPAVTIGKDAQTPLTPGQGKEDRLGEKRRNEHPPRPEAGRG